MTTKNTITEAEAVNTVLENLNPDFKFPNWKNITGSFGAILCNCLINEGIDPNHVQLDLDIKSGKCVAYMGGRKKTFKLTNAISVLKVVKNLQK